MAGGLGFGPCHRFQLVTWQEVGLYTMYWYVLIYLVFQTFRIFVGNCWYVFTTWYVSMYYLVCLPGNLLGYANQRVPCFPAVDVMTARRSSSAGCPGGGGFRRHGVLGHVLGGASPGVNQGEV